MRSIRIKKGSFAERPVAAIRAGSVAFSRTRNLIRLGFVLFLLCLAFIGAVSYRNTQDLLSIYEQITRMQDVRALIGDAVDSSSNLQIAARGYILSGRPEDYDNYVSAAHRYQRSINELRAQTSHDDFDGGNSIERSEEDISERFIRLTSLRPAELHADVLRRKYQGAFTKAEIDRLLRAENESLSNQNRAARRFRSAEEDFLGPYYKIAGVTSYQTQKIIIFGSFGAVLVVFGALLLIDRDMYVRKDVEDKLAKSEQRFRAIIENASDLITVIDESGRLLYFSPSAARLSGAATADAGGHFPMENVHPDDRETLQSAFEEARRTSGVTVPVGFRYAGADGEYRWMESVASNQTSVPGVEGIVIATRDVSDRRQAEEAVRLSEARLREAQRIAGLGTWEYDLTTRKLAWSEEVARLYGFDPAGSAPDFDIFLSRIHAEAGKLSGTPIEKVIASGKELEYDQMILWPDGTVRYARATIHPVTDTTTGQTLRLLGTALDITARKESERAREALVEELRESENKLRQAADELYRSNRELSAFATVASHDLQEPLRKIRTFADMIERRTAGKLDDATGDYLRRMKQSSERMQSLVESVLELSRVSTRPRKPVPVDLEKVVADVLSDLEPRIDSSHGRVEVTGPLPRIEADPIPIRQLIQNLIGNALKFHRPDEAPLVKVNAAVVRQLDVVGDVLLGSTDWLKLTVSDNGIGFAPDHSERIFQAFERLEDRNRYEGNGVGLAICRRIVERHGGSITADSTPGNGATFTVLLPYGRSKSETSAPAGDDAAQKSTVLG